MHRLLQRQVRRYLGSYDYIPEELQRFIQAVDAAYQQSDDDRALLERSLELTSQELLERNEQLRLRREELEQMVTERTKELETRTIQLKTAAEVARDATTARNLDDLLNHAVSLVRERFGFYHTSIYLLDERGKTAILMAATGSAGQQMLAQEFTYNINDPGPLGAAIKTSQPQIDLEMGSGSDHPLNPLLPETRSELVLPLRVGEQVIGIFDVHSRQEAAFDDNNVSILQTLADQLAVAISNTRLFQEMGQTLRELQAATGRYTQDVWATVVQRSGKKLGYRYRGLGIEPLRQIPEEIDPSSPSEEKSSHQLSVPIRLRDQVIGTLNLRVTEKEMLPETSALAASVAERMALALENARLLQETQQRAEQERLIGNISARMRETLDIETVLKTAAHEMRKSFGLAEVEIRMGEFVPSNTDDHETSGE